MTMISSFRVPMWSHIWPDTTFFSLSSSSHKEITTAPLACSLVWPALSNDVCRFPTLDHPQACAGQRNNLSPNSCSQWGGTKCIYCWPILLSWECILLKTTESWPDAVLLCLLDKETFTLLKYCHFISTNEAQRKLENNKEQLHVVKIWLICTFVLDNYLEKKARGNDCHLHLFNAIHMPFFCLIRKWKKYEKVALRKSSLSSSEAAQ